MPSGEITATVNIGEDVYILDIGQIYEVNKAMFPSEEQSVPEGKVRNRQKDTPENTLDSTWVIHFMGLIPLSDKERNEVLTEALMLQRQFIEKEEQMYKQSIQSLIRQMEQRLHERESLEAGRWYSMDELPQRWQVLLGQALAERGVTQANMANAQVRFSVAPGLQFLLKKGEQRHVLGFRLSEPRVFTYTLNSSKP